MNLDVQEPPSRAEEIALALAHAHPWAGDFTRSDMLRCHRCRGGFPTGAIVLSIGNEATKRLRPVRHYCKRCGFLALTSGQQIRRASVYVARDHATLRWSDVPARERERVVETIELLERLASRLGVAPPALPPVPGVVVTEGPGAILFPDEG